MKPAFTMLSSNRFFQVNRHLVEREINSSVTVTFMAEVDLTGIEELRKNAGSDRPSYTALIAKAVAQSLKAYPYANRRVCKRGLLGTRLQEFHHCDIAVAAERDVHIPGAEGVAFVDVLRNADSQSLTSINQWLRQLSQATEETNEQWRSFSSIVRSLPSWLAGRLIRLPLFLPSAWVKYRGGAVLISSPAKYGVDAVNATWPWPLGVSFGLVKKRPVVKNDQIVICPTFMFVLNFDRRIMAGAPAAKFFKHIVTLLEDPRLMLAGAAESAAVPSPSAASSPSQAHAVVA